ncbi:Imm52 family immunity protein [Kutzneria sp. CA-103260]|uniref:Imm52 family immunity protein n=1 Tax=Kutzneria sp. CA-103260 TaxID=2802641 RepID=UPI001BA8EE3F|nr:Imm52 family immunity protein [Kutzneria sp. CA-103260]QUQ68305.1 Immunity protein 52 [Kutzneria sp. CA-103260]
MSTHGSSWPGTVDLSHDTWLFEAGWAARRDDPADCTARLLACLTEVAALDPLLSRWYHGAEPVAVDEPSLRSRVDANWDNPTSSTTHGTVISLRNGMTDDLTVATFSVSCGATASYLRNSVELRPPLPVSVPHLYQLDTMLGLVDSMISVWQPQWCRVRPRSLAEATGRDTVDVLASWIVYLDEGSHRRTDGALPEEVDVLERANGEMFVLAPTAERVQLATIDRLREHITLADAARLG